MHANDNDMFLFEVCDALQVRPHLAVDIAEQCREGGIGKGQIGDGSLTPIQLPVYPDNTAA